MGLMQEFKEFAMKGNVVDMAVGIVIGGAFGKLVTSFVDNVLMPPIGLLLGGVDFSSLGIKLTDSVTWKVGAFVQTVVDFAIIAFALFMVIKAMNRLRAPAPPPPPPPVPDDVKLLTEIRDLLKK
jgi:large conductance mechanosensitive channel